MCEVLKIILRLLPLTLYKRQSFQSRGIHMWKVTKGKLCAIMSHDFCGDKFPYQFKIRKKQIQNLSIISLFRFWFSFVLLREQFVWHLILKLWETFVKVCEMGSDEIIKNSYVVNFARLLVYAVHSVWDRIMRSIFGISGSDVTQNEQQNKNFDDTDKINKNSTVNLITMLQ